MYKLTKDIGKLIRIFYENIELGSDEIREMYDGISKSAIQTLKKKARKVMVTNDVMPWDANKVNTESAFVAWGLEIADLERRYAKLQKFNRKE